MVREPTAEAVPLTQEEEPKASPPAPGTELKLEHVADAWQRTIVEIVRDRQPPAASLLAGTKPTKLADDTLTLEFPPGHDFHRTQLDEPKYKNLLRDALYEVTGRRLAVVLEAGEGPANGEDSDDEPVSEEDWISSLKETFDAREVDDQT